MIQKKKRFLQILRIELDDLRDDIDEMITQHQQVKDAGKISEHVYLENLSVFRNELLGIGTFDRIIDKINTGNDETLDEMIESVEQELKIEIKKYGLAPVVSIYIERKINKVRKYVDVE